MSPYSAVLKLAHLNGKNGFRLDGEEAGDENGSSVSSAGDFNGDGLDDFIIGAPLWGADNFGVSYVVFGRATPFNSIVKLGLLDGTDGFRIEGTGPGDLTGTRVSSAGDINADGFDDLLIGAPVAEIDNVNSGIAYIVYGKATGFDGTIVLADLDGGNGFKINGQPGSRFGTSVAPAGDINGDGIEDIVVGANAADNGSIRDAGATYVLFGRASGFASEVSITDLNGSNGFQIIGDTKDLNSGRSVDSAGDINNDGFDDLIIGSILASANGVRSGASYIVFGRSAGFQPSLSLDTLDGTTGFRIDGSMAGDEFGLTVSSAGDVNADGIDDIVVGANAGSSYVIFGSSSGYDSVISLAGLNGSNGFRIDGSGRSVSAAGDVNGDGFGDLIIGAPRAQNGAGSSYVVFGQASSAAVVNLSTLDGVTGYRIDGAVAGGESGNSVSGAGDVNGDGLGDLLIGASYAALGTSSAGRGYIVFGALPGEAVVRVGTGQSQTIQGGGFNDEIRGLAGDDRLIGHAGRDLLDGGLDRDTLTGGAGVDTLVGGLGNDTYVDPTGDTITELAAGGTDTVQSGVTFTLSGRQQVENLTLTGAGNVNASGNSYNNVLTGNSGNNILNGSTGADTMAGGAGNDTYYIDSAGDQTVELAGGGTDIVSSSVSRTLSVNVENLNLSGVASIDGNGNTGANRINGNAGNNVLQGFEGSDTLNGGGGNDILLGGTSSDSLNPGDDAVRDIIRFSAVGESTGSQRDIVTGMDLNAEDRFDFTVVPTALAYVGGGTLSLATINADLATAVNAALAVNGVVLFDPNAGDLNAAGHLFIVVDGNGDGMYTANQDHVVQLINSTGFLSLDDFI